MPPELAEKTVKAIENESFTTEIAKIAAFLTDKIGQKPTAYLSGVESPKEVGNWARGDVKPRDMAENRLRCAFQAVRLLVKAYGPDTAKAWLFGTNTRLGDEAPAFLMRHAKSIEDIRGIVPTARAFAGASE